MQAVHVFERGATAFDLREENGIVAYVAFLVRLYTDVRTSLSTKLVLAGGHVRAKLQQEGKESLGWSMMQHAKVAEIEKERGLRRKAKAREDSEAQPKDERQDAAAPAGDDAK